MSVADVFTACYTTIMAVAAVADASHKDERRKQLDRRLEDAKADLARVMRMAPELEQAARYTSTTTPRSPTPSSSLVEALTSICVPHGQLRRHLEDAVRRTRRRDRLHLEFGLRRKPYHDAVLGHLDGAREAVAAEVPTRQREPASVVQLLRNSEMVDGLVNDLMSQAYARDFPDLEARRRWVQSLDGAWTALRLLRSEGYPGYKLPTTDAGWTAEVRRELDDSIRTLFQQWEQKRGATTTRPLERKVHIWVAKICHNLLVASVPPGIQTYNALVLGFTQLGEHDLAQVVVKSFLDYSQMVPTQQTLVCLLHHYRASGNIVGFYAMLRRFIGTDSRGVKLRRAPVRAVAEDPFLFRWAQTSDIAIVDNLVVERARIDEDVFDALVRGLLSFGQIRHATIVCASHFGSCVGTPVFMGLVERVLGSLDVTAAHILLKSFVDHVDLLTQLLLRPGSYARLLSGNIRLLIALVSGPPPRGLSKSPRRSRTPQTIVTRCQQLVAALHIAEMSTHLHRVGRMLSRVADAVGAGADGESIDTALMVLNRFAVLQLQAEKREAGIRRVARFVVVDEDVERELRRGASLLEEFCHVVSDKTPLVYQSFLRRRTLPFAIRFQSWLAMTSTSSSYEHLHRQVLDGIAVVRYFESRLKWILLGPLLRRAQAQDSAIYQGSKRTLPQKPPSFPLVFSQTARAKLRCNVRAGSLGFDLDRLPFRSDRPQGYGRQKVESAFIRTTAR